MKNKKALMTILVIILILLILSIFLYTCKSNLVKLSYNEIIEKINNKEDFILCVSASNCVHCKDYKPKLKKISNEYDIVIYYTNIDSFSDAEYDLFKRDFSFDGSTPVTIFFKKGEEKTTATRINGNERIDKIIDKLKKNGFINE